MILCLWLLTILCHVANSCLQSMNTGTLYPRDSNYPVGETINLRCVLSKNSVLLRNGQNYTFNSSFIYFKLGGNKLSSEVKIVDEKEAVTVIKNGQLEDNGVYYCMLKLNNQTDLLVCPSRIDFGYPPEGVKDLKCRSYYWENLTCSWTIPKNPASVTYKLKYRPDNSLSWDCAIKSKTSCGWTVKTSPVYVQQSTNISISITGSNGIGNKSLQNFVFNHWSIVVADIPEFLNVTDRTSTSLFLHWEPPTSMKRFPAGICYRILYGTKSSSMEVKETGANNTDFTLTGLIPNTQYLVQVQARSCEAPADVENDLWGPTTSITGKTEPDIPWYSPEADGTFFETSRIDLKRNVIVYWKQVEKSFENGDDFHYVVSLEKISGNDVERDTSHEANITVNHKIFGNLDLNSTYAVQIWSANAKGRSMSSTRFIIPETYKLLQQPLHIRPVNVEGGRYVITWKAPKVDVGGYFLVWCQGESRCEKDMNWKKVSSDTTMVSLLLDENRSYEFGVAAILSDGQQISSLEWAPCIAYKKRALEHLEEVKIDGITSHSLTVNWKPTCEAQKALVENYQVVLCKRGCHENKNDLCKAQETKTINDPEAESVVFNDLAPYTTYTATVVAISQKGRSPESSVDCIRTLSDAPSNPPVLLPPSTVTNTSVTLFWEPSKNTNGIVNHYKIYYKEMSTWGPSHSEEWKDVSVPTAYSDATLLNYAVQGLKCFSNYSITISACVDTHCSAISSPIYVKTSIGVPGPMDPPRAELNSSHVRIIWKRPDMPNGPVDCYLLHVFKREGNNVTKLDTLNVTGTSVELALNCSPTVEALGKGAHVFSIQALNLVPGEDYLYGPVSNTTETNLCIMGRDMDNAIVIGIIVGSTLAFAIVILSLYSALRWMNEKVKKMKNIKVILPDGLQQPYSQSLNSYENFKNGLSTAGSDPNLSPKLGYERRDSTGGDLDNNHHEDSFKNRHGSGTSHFSTTSTDELINKQNQGGQVTAAKNMTITGQKTMNKGDRNPSGDSSSGHESISSSLTHRTNVSTDGSSSSEGSSAQGKDPQSSRDSGLDEESKPHTKRPSPGVTLPTNCHYLPTTPYSKLGFLENKCIGDYHPLARGRHLNLYSHNLANSEPSITDLNQQPYTLEHHAQCDPSSPVVPYSKFGISQSVTDLMLEGIDVPESPLSSQPSPEDALPYSRFGLRRPPLPIQSSPYVTMGMALITGPQKIPTQLLPSKMEPNPLVLKSPINKDKNEVHPPDLLTTSDDAYSKLGLSSMTDNSGSPKIHPYLTLQEVRENEQNNHSLPDITIPSRENSPLHQVPGQVQLSLGETSSKSGYLPHQLIPTVVKAPEPSLPDFINCSNALPLLNGLQDEPEIKIQGNNGYVSLNQVLANNTKV